MDEYLDGAGIAEDKATPPFRTAVGKIAKLTDRRMTRTDALRMIWRRAAAAGLVATPSARLASRSISKNGGLLEHAQQMAAHESARATNLSDRRGDKITLGEVEKILV